MWVHLYCGLHSLHCLSISGGFSVNRFFAKFRVNGLNRELFNMAYIAKLMFATLDLIEKYDLVIRLMDRRKLV